MTQDRIYIRPDTFLLLVKGKYHPYRVMSETVNCPIRGFDKRGKSVWRSYKTVEEAETNLFA